MGSRARRRMTAAIGAALLVAGLSGCGPAFQEVLVVGHDDNGTAVVGAVDCGLDDRLPAEVVSVSLATGSGMGQELWRVERPGTGRAVPETGPAAPPPPSPRFIGGVEMIAIGDPLPSGGDVAVAQVEPLPEEVVVEAYTFSDDSNPIGRIRLGPDEPGTYAVALYEGETASGLDATAAADLIDDACADDGPVPDGGVVLATAGITLGALALLSVPLGVVTARQYRRAAAHRSRPPGGNPRGPGS